MTQIVDMAAFRGPTAQMVDLSKFTFWGPPQDMDFFYKQSARTGRAWLRSIHGRTVSINQLVGASDINGGTSSSGVTVVNNNDGSVSFTGIVEVFTNLVLLIGSGTFIAGHKYYAKGGISSGIYFQLFTFSDTGGGIVFTAPSTARFQDETRFRGQSGQDFNNLKIWPEIVDLTQAGLDSIITTPEQFEAWQMEQFGHNDYIAYTPGKLVSVNPTGVKTTTPGGDEHTLPLDFTEHFPTGMNGVNGIYDEVVSDENGKFTDGGKRFGKVDLGDLTWSALDAPNGRFYADIPTAKGSDSSVGNCICGLYQYVCMSYSESVDMSLQLRTNHRLYVRNSAYTTSAGFKAAMSGVYLIYELATPQHVTFTDPSDAVYPVTEGGTEQVLPVNGSEPTTGPLLGKVSYKQGRSAQ